ncbi:MAG: 3-oxoacyl-[acyl-carrier-protein] synthase III C-terminal domain-containing protein, partial [Thermovirgaceae bacterium]|nr:3-oxoacyl-[acyl-carrier-protein] synthase III C-terminal domain-containing protein [Thermovirgaceae bacterium]
ARHDAAHAADLAVWREVQGLQLQLQMGVGPRQILLAALTAAREALLAAAALVSPDERVSRPVCGEWTLKDVLAHVADWEWVGVEGLRHMAAGQQPQVEHIKDIDAWIFHQANLRIIEGVLRRLDVPVEKAIVNLQKYGNTSAASIFLALNEGISEGRISPGDKVMIASFGAGMTYGAMILEI